MTLFLYQHSSLNDYHSESWIGWFCNTLLCKLFGQQKAQDYQLGDPHYVRDDEVGSKRRNGQMPHSKLTHTGA